MIKKLYTCDPRKNIKCAKTSCVHSVNAVEHYCSMTTEKKYRVGLVRRIINMLKKTLRQRRNKELNGYSPTMMIIDEAVTFNKPSPKFIKTWEELKACTSETHTLEIDVEGGNGWIYPKVSKNSLSGHHYLSTHTFYGSNYLYSTELLQSCGFNVFLANWDGLGW